MVASFAGIFLLAGIIAFGTALARLSSDRDKLRTVLSASRFEAERQRKASAIQNTLRESKEAIENLRNIFLGSDNIIPFVETVESLGKTLPVGLSLNSVTLSPTKDALTARLSARGSFAELYRILAVIEALPYKIEIGDTQLSYGGGDSAGLLSAGGDRKVAPPWSLVVTLTVKSVLPENTIR